MAFDETAGGATITSNVKGAVNYLEIFFDANSTNYRLLIRMQQPHLDIFVVPRIPLVGDVCKPADAVNSGSNSRTRGLWWCSCS